MFIEIKTDDGRIKGKLSENKGCSMEISVAGRCYAGYQSRR